MFLLSPGADVDPGGLQVLIFGKHCVTTAASWPHTNQRRIGGKARVFTRRQSAEETYLLSVGESDFWSSYKLYISCHAVGVNRFESFFEFNVP